MKTSATFWLSGFALIALFCLLVRLGFWQLQRAAEKAERYASYQERSLAPPVDLINWKANVASDLYWRSVHGFGYYEGPTILLDNRPRDGRNGFEVLSALRLENAQVVLVDRGWIVASPDRRDWPDIDTPTGRIELTGRAGPAPVSGLKFNEAAEEIERLKTGLLRVQRVNLDALSEELNIALAPYVVYLDARAPGKLRRDWPAPGDKSARSRAYATQWFTMAAVLVIIAAMLLRRHKG